MKANDANYKPPCDEGPPPGTVHVTHWPKWPEPSPQNGCEAYPTNCTSLTFTTEGTISLDQINKLIELFGIKNVKLTMINKTTQANVRT